MGKLALQLDNAPDGVGSKQLFDDEKHLQKTLKSWEDTGKMSKINVKGAKMTFEHGEEKGTGVIKEVDNNFQFEPETESED